MNRAELIELILNCEDSCVEFKGDDIQDHELAKDLVAFLNLEGGAVLIGIEDDGSISGTTRGGLEEWVSQLCRANIEPPIVPLLSWTRNIKPGRNVLAIRVTLGPDKPYACVHSGRKTCYIRVGSSSRETSCEELERMHQASRRWRYGMLPVPGAGLETLDARRLHDYLNRVLEGTVPPETDIHRWETLLRNIKLMTVSAGQRVATVDGLLLFGKTPSRYVPQTGVRAICYSGRTRDHATRAGEHLRGSLTPLRAQDGTLVEAGLVDQAWDFVRRNTTPLARLESAPRIDRWGYPEEEVREVVVNALIHRDYSISGADVMLAIYSDRLEVVSPEGLPNRVTPEGMKWGLRYARNQTLVNVMRDYGYVGARGMGVRTKIIPGMLAHNGTEPELIEEEHRFTVRLWKEPFTQPDRR